MPDRATTHEAPPALARRAAMVLLAAAGLGFTGILLYQSMTGVAIAGCGVRKSCDVVLASDWSVWLGVPVTIPAFGLWLFMLVAAAGGWLRPLRYAALLATAAGVWFVYLQVVKVQTLCPYCMAAHGCALAMLVLALVGVQRIPWGGVLLAGVCMVVLAGGQVLVTPQPKPIRLVTHGQLKINTERLPVLGSRDAPHLFIYFFDYTCVHCRETHAVLMKARERYGDQVAIALAPAPLDASCNPLLTETHDGNREACALARLMLKLHMHDPATLPVFDSFVAGMNPPTLDGATAFAVERFGREAVDNVLLHAVAGSDLEAWCQLNAEVGKSINHPDPESVPKLVLGNGTVIPGPIPDPEALYRLLENDLGLKPVESARLTPP